MGGAYPNLILVRHHHLGSQDRGSKSFFFIFRPAIKLPLREGGASRTLLLALVEREIVVFEDYLTSAVGDQNRERSPPLKMDSPDLVRKLIRQTRTLTNKPFGIGVVLPFPHKETVRVILEEQVAVIHVSWGEYPRELVDEAHKFGVKVIHQVGAFEDAEKAVAAGVDAIIVQGIEAGGHVMGKEGQMALLPRVVDMVRGHDIPIIAAGGIVDARGYVAALVLGARGVCLGTRFVATWESYAHPLYKQKLVEEFDTEYTNVFGRARWPGAPHRVLETSFFKTWKLLPADENEAHQPTIGHTKIYDKELDVHRFSGTVPNATTVGDVESMAMYAGQGVGLIKEILPAAEVVRGLVEGAQHIIERLNGVINISPQLTGIQKME